MFGRRQILQMLGAAPMAGPAIARQAVETMTAELAGVSTAGFSGNGASQAAPSAAPWQIEQFDERKALRRLLETPEHRADYASLLYERNHQVGVLDIDLASKRSFSLAAKITFQRQRNVERQIADEAAEIPPWSRAQAFLKNAAGWPWD